MGIKYITMILPFLWLFFNSCDLFIDDLTVKMDKAAFEREYAAWKSQGLTNYRFTYEYFNDAGPVGPVKITIRENSAPLVEYASPWDYPIAATMPEIYDHIQGTFDFIESVETGAYGGPKIARLDLDITYDARYHYPKKVRFSPYYAEPLDGGPYYTLQITEFIP